MSGSEKRVKWKCGYCKEYRPAIGVYSQFCCLKCKNAYQKARTKRVGVVHVKRERPTFSASLNSWGMNGLSRSADQDQHEQEDGSDTCEHD